MNHRRIYAIFRKEFQHITRDRRSLAATIILPVFMLFLVVYSSQINVKPVRLAVIDADQTSLSRLFLKSLENTSYFQLKWVLQPEEGLEWVRKGKAEGAVFIPKDFSYSLLKGTPDLIDVIFDTAHPMNAKTYLSYLESAFHVFPLSLPNEYYFFSSLKPKDLPFHPYFFTLFNPKLDHFAIILPPVFGTIIMAIFPIFSALSIVREREFGTFNRYLASPASSLEFLMGKLLAYFLLALITYFFLVAVGLLWFQIPFRGSVIEFILLSMPFVLWAVTFGMTISTFTHDQMTALMTCTVLTLLPSIFLTGVTFPIETMPKPVQWVTYLYPVRYFVEIVKDIFLKGTHIWDWWKPFLALNGVLGLTFLAMYFRFGKLVEDPSK